MSEHQHQQQQQRRRTQTGGCGLKNSGCPGSTHDVNEQDNGSLTPPAEFYENYNDDSRQGILYRFLFVDGNTGL